MAMPLSQLRPGPEEEGVAETDVDLRGDEGDGRLAGLFLGGSGGLFRRSFHGLGRLCRGRSLGGLLRGLFHGDFLFQVKEAVNFSPPRASTRAISEPIAARD
jgi:hypothetical protein